MTVSPDWGIVGVMTVHPFGYLWCHDTGGDNGVMATTTAQDIRSGDMTREYGRIVSAVRTQTGMQIRYVQSGHRGQRTLALSRKLTVEHND